MDYFKNEKEIQKRQELQCLFEVWKSQIKTKDDIVFSDDQKSYPAIDYFYTDGFYPGYFSSQNIKILFIGREARYSSTSFSNGDRVLTDLEWFKTVNINKSSYWRRILYIVKGIKEDGLIPFKNLKTANDILTEMKEKNDFGFAIMNISKYSNDSENGAKADYDLINRFLNDTELKPGNNFILDEIRILEPDIIITANLWDGNINTKELEKIFPDKDCKIINVKKGIATIWDFALDGKIIKLIDTWHFSTMGSDQELFYNPIMDFYKNYIKQ